MAKKGQIIQEKVISEALRIVQEEGQHNLTIRKITSNTGYNTGSIYAQFQNIDEIILKINSITLKRIKVLLLNITTQHKLNSLQNTLTTLTTEFINFAKQEKQYLTYLKKRRRNVKMSPGTAATVSIKCETSFKSCKMKSNTKPFLKDMYRTAYAATDFMIHMIDSFETWCNQMGLEENEVSFQRFGNIVEEDLPISKEINDGINKFSYNFTNLRSLQPWPDSPPNEYTVSLNNEFSNLSWSIP